MVAVQRVFPETVRETSALKLIVLEKNAVYNHRKKEDNAFEVEILLHF